jgi:hypothetical protein
MVVGKEGNRPTSQSEGGGETAWDVELKYENNNLKG